MKTQPRQTVCCKLSITHYILLQTANTVATTAGIQTSGCSRKDISSYWALKALNWKKYSQQKINQNCRGGCQYDYFCQKLRKIHFI